MQNSGTGTSSGVVEVNVGGHIYSTTVETLTTKYPSSKLAQGITSFLKQKQGNQVQLPILRDSQGRIFIDRDGESFRYILNYLRRDNASDNWVTKMIPKDERNSVQLEAEFYGLSDLAIEISKTFVKFSASLPFREKSIEKENIFKDVSMMRQGSVGTGPLSRGAPYFISIGCRGYYSAERDNPINDLAKFRKITRITVCGRSDVAKEVFAGELNESRDPERFPPETYTCRYYLTHNYLENAFEALARRGFELVTSFSTGNQTLPSVTKSEFKQWSTYVEYVFYRPARNFEGTGL